MNVVYASDDNFAEILGISIISIFENNKNCEEIVVYILDDGIKEDNRKKIVHVSQSYNRSVFFIDVSSALDPDMKQQRGSLSTFSRLYMCKLLPKEINKVLYLDCDVLVLKKLDELYGLDIEEFYCAGVGDCVSDNHLKSIGTPIGACYFNAGVILVNLKKWRLENVEESFFRFSEKYDNNVPYADQGILNGVLSGKVMKADLKYNSYTALHDFSYSDLMIFRKPSVYYSEAEVKEAVDDPVVIHFTTSFLSLRPWIEECNHPYVNEWLKYKAMSPWADVPLRKDNRSFKKKAAVRIYKMLPHWLAVRIAGWLHSNIVPRLRGK